MTPTRLLLGAAAAALLSTAAFAQDAPSAQPEQKSGDNIVNPAATPMPAEPAPAPAVSAPSAAAMGADASVTASAVDAPAPVAGTVTVSTVTNGPVPDTAENRAKYGAPMSRAGKLTRAAGN
jgi:hypothetical protein